MYITDVNPEKLDKLPTEIARVQYSQTPDHWTVKCNGRNMQKKQDKKKKQKTAQSKHILTDNLFFVAAHGLAA